MFFEFRKKIAEFIAPEYVEGIDALQERVDAIEETIRNRIAKVLNDLDPFEPLMQKYKGVFSNVYERMEEPLDEKSRLALTMFAWQMDKDPYWKFMTDWVMNKQGNAMLHAPARTNEERGEIMLYGKAQISSMILLTREIGRLSSLYQELLDNKGEEFNSSLTVE